LFISGLNEEKMKSIEIPYGHRIKILKKLKEFKVHRNKANESDLAYLAVEAQMNSTFTEMGVGIGTDTMEDKDAKSEADIRENDNTFNEEEQQRLFKEAVEEFRKGKKQDTNNNVNSKKITIIKEVDEEVNEVSKN